MKWQDASHFVKESSLFGEDVSSWKPQVLVVRVKVPKTHMCFTWCLKLIIKTVRKAQFMAEVKVGFWMQSLVCTSGPCSWAPQCHWALDCWHGPFLSFDLLWSFCITSSLLTASGGAVLMLPSGFSSESRDWATSFLIIHPHSARTPSPKWWNWLKIISAQTLWSVFLVGQDWVQFLAVGWGCIRLLAYVGP